MLKGPLLSGNRMHYNVGRVFFFGNRMKPSWAPGSVFKTLDTVQELK